MAEKLEQFRVSRAEEMSDSDLTNLKKTILDCQNHSELVEALSNIPEIKKSFYQLQQSSLLEELVMVSSSSKNPLTSFPFNINRNHYSDILDFALVEAKEVLSLLVNLTIRKEITIMENQVLSLSSLFSTLASAVSKKNNALQKTKTAAAKTNFLTNTGVDDFSKLGFLESSRS